MTTAMHPRRPGHGCGVGAPALEAGVVGDRHRHRAASRAIAAGSAPATACRWRSAGPRCHARGYTLIEVIVAFALLALALTLLLGSLSNAARQVHWADGAGRATLHAQSLLDQVGVGEPLQAGTRQGSFDNERYHWTLAINPYIDPGTHRIAATADGAQLFQVDLAIEWGASAAQHLDVHTLRLSRSDTVQSIPGI
jgi:general secretion pathway protein I|nr:prepilin-type N-terminal cleavage/methylation domain-containing protein [Lysobacter telluris]